MASKSLCLVIFFKNVLLFSGGVTVIEFQRFRNYPVLEQKVCNTNDVLFNAITDKVITCCVQCAQKIGCRSFMYNRSTKDCIGCSEKYTKNSGMGMAAGYQYYENTTNNYNATCANTADCNGKNIVCEKTRLQCGCYPGYSYRPSGRSCVAGCDIYGNTYEKYPNLKLFFLNTATYNSSNFDDCANRCNTAAFQCKSFELGTGGQSQCRLSTATAQTDPDAMMYDDQSDYYNRNCA